MNNSNKLKDDIKKHNGTAWAKAWLEESENELNNHAVDALAYTMRHFGMEDSKKSSVFNTMLDFVLAKDIKVTAADECPHTNKRKEGIHTLFWVCNKCGKDLGNV